ncbi:MAG TPA: polyphosphate kinase 2 family protein [Anaerohalosphaeraceae bacterium]|nr:polyphosphate kinase 2 family protein [Anaerohalosphaeraceae bacterium]
MGKNNLYGKMCRCEPGVRHRLSRWDPDETTGLDKEQAQEQFDKTIKRLQELEFLLYAENKQSVLVVLQAMDAGGKDGTIRNVFGPLNPQSCKVTAFKTPTSVELSHDFLWRIHAVTPRPGEIAVFNRSHYEDVLIARVKNLVPKTIWSKRYRQINDFERLLAENGTHILKFFLHISRDEQLKRLKKRLEDPTRYWKVDPADFEERKLWGDYQKAYEDAFTRCSTDYAPWYIIPANHKWFRNLAIARILAETLEGLKMTFPAPKYDVKKIKVK